MAPTPTATSPRSCGCLPGTDAGRDGFPQRRLPRLASIIRPQPQRAPRSPPESNRSQGRLSRGGDELLAVEYRRFRRPQISRLWAADRRKGVRG